MNFLKSKRFSRMIVGFFIGLAVAFANIYLWGLIFGHLFSSGFGVIFFFVLYFIPVVILASVASFTYLGYQFGKNLDFPQIEQKPRLKIRNTILIFFGVLIVPIILLTIISSLTLLFGLLKEWQIPSWLSGPKNRDGQVCIQVIAPAKNPKTGECREFPNPCQIPNGWEMLEPGQPCN